MPMSEAEYERRFGKAWHVNGKTGDGGVGQVMTYRTYAGTPGGNVTPNFLGEWLFDTVNEDFYLATGDANTDWKQVTA